MVSIFTGLGAGFERGSGATLGGTGLLGAGTLGRSAEQVSLNAATGNLLISQRDEFLVGQGPDSAIGRTYNSIEDVTDGDNNDHWRQSTARSIHGLTGTLNANGSTIKRTSGDGSDVTYTWNGSVYVATAGAGAYDTLANASGVWTWTDGDTHYTEKYAAYGTDFWRITELADISGNKLSFTYSGAQLDKVTTQNGEYEQFGWSGGAITQIATGYTDLATNTAKTLTRTRYGYDGSGRLASVTVDLTPGDNSVSDGATYVTTYTYDCTSKRVASIVQTDGASLAIGYDTSGRVATLTQTVAGGVTRVTTIGYYAGYTTITDPLLQVTRLDYDASNQLTKITSPPPVSGISAQVTQFAYTANGDVASVADALGQTDTATYDASGNVLTATDRLGNVVTRTYDAQNAMTSEARTGSDAGSAAAIHTTHYAYDDHDRLSYIVSPEGDVTEIRRDATTGDPWSTVVYNGQKYTGTSFSWTDIYNWVTSAAVDGTALQQTLYGYDARGALVHELGFAASTGRGSVGGTDGWYDHTYTYDQAGQLLTSITATQSMTHYVYDGLGRMTASVDLNGGTTNIAFNDAAMTTIVTLANGLVTTSTFDKAGDLLSVAQSGPNVGGTPTASYRYDQLGRLRVTTDANGTSRYYVYDAVGRKVADVDAAGAMAEYRYDADDRLVATVRYDTAVSASALTTLANENAAVTTATVRPTSSTADLWTWQVYDKEGRRIETIDGTGEATTFGYDASGQLVATLVYANLLGATTIAGFKTTPPATLQLPTADAVNDRIARTFYDRDGALIGQLDGNGNLSQNVYDAGGQLVRQTDYANATDPSYRATGTFNDLIAHTLTSPADRSTRYVYDAQGHLAFVIDAQNNVTERVYPSDVSWGATGQAHKTVRYAAPIATLSAYTMATVRSALSSTGVSSSAANRISYAVYDEGARLAYAIDAAGAVTGYSYDTVGNPVKTVAYSALDTGLTAVPSKSTMDSWAASNASATGDRVTRAYYASRGELLYTLDAEGFVTGNHYNLAGQLDTVTRWDAAVTGVTDTTSIATLAGMLSGTTTVRAFTYDAEGRVQTATDESGIVRRTSYNANGTLASATAAYGTADAVQTRYVYDGAGRTVGETAAFGTPEQRTASWSYDGLGNLVAATDANGNVTTFGYDRLGRQVTSTDALGGVTGCQYDSFGAVVKTTDPRGIASYAYYDTLGRLTATRDGEDYVTETSYTTFGEVATVTRRANRATNGASVTSPPTCTADAAKDATTSFSYDRLGRVLASTDALGFVESYTLNAFGQRVTVTGKLGAVTTNAYDRRGLLVQETLPISSVRSDGSTAAASVINTFGYDARGNRTVMVEASGLTEQRTTTYVYDKLDRLIETHLPVVANATGTGTVSPVDYAVYDARGNVIEQRDAGGARTLFYYDKLDRQIASIGATGTCATTIYAIVAGTGGTQTDRTYATQVTLPTTAGGTPPPTPSGEYRETVATYDKLGRLASSAMTNVRTGSWSGSAYATSVGTVTATWQYDADGNLTKTVDGTGATTFTYYDKLGRKTGSVDQLGYLTSWTLDGEGNALAERRYATAATGVTTSAPPSVSTAAADRVTNFTYDRNGNRLTEQRTGLDYYTINATSGALTLVSGGSATVGYTYNALGQVLTKTEATGEAIGYSYDSAGRLSVESRTAYLDQTGASVTPTVRYFYDALGNLTRSQQGGASASSGDRVTTYAYGAGGRLTAMTDAGGTVRRSYYDVVGRKVGEAYDRVKADGSTVLHEGLSYQYDAVGNLVRQAFATVSGGTFSDAGDVTTLAYDAYGDVTGRSLNGTLQETSSYDTAGHLWRTTSGDGVWRYYVYDANGRQTLALEDAGIGGGALVNRTLDSVLALATNTGSNTVGAAYVAGINATITQFDARGQAITAVQAKRQLSATGTPVDLTAQRGYNAYGEAVSETDALGHVTTTSYNALGRAISVQHAAVSVGNADGTITTGVTPTDTYFYDVAGRLIGQQDAGGHRITRLLIAGTGYGQATALVSKEFHADGGVKQGGYDVYGDLRTATDEITRATTNLYDALGRLTQVTHAGGLIDTYSYDALGQRTKHGNSFLGTGNVETTDYDVQGRIVSTRAFGGDLTITGYVWNGSLATTGLGTFGGYQQTTTSANGRTTVESSDAFGHVVSHTDMGGHVSAFGYDSGGRLVGKTMSGTGTSGADTVAYTYLNTNLVATATTGVYGSGGSGPSGNHDYTVATYTYDGVGHKLTETSVHDFYVFIPGGPFQGPTYASGTEVRQNATATYDALGRMTAWSDAGGTVVANGVSLATPGASKTWSYDAVGNIRHLSATYKQVEADGSTPYSASENYWYLYDTLNRIVTTKGSLSGTSIVRGSGTDIYYNASGQRTQTITTVDALAHIVNPDWPDNKAGGPHYDITYSQQRREEYSYDSSGNLAAIRVAQSSYEDNGDGSVTVYAPPATGALKSTFTTDLLGRVVRQQDWTGDGTGVAYDRQVTFDDAGRVSSEVDVQKQGSDTYASSVTNQFGTVGTSSYALGAVTASTTVSSKNGGASTTASTSTSYAWYDGAVQSSVAYQADVTQSTIFTTTYANTGSGVFVSAHVADGRPRDIAVTRDALGQALRRDEADATAGGDPHEVWYRFDGRQIGYVGNNGTFNTDEQSSIDQRIAAAPSGTSAFRSGGGYAADFDQNYDAINSYSQGAGGGTYSVRQGDTLAGIAAQLWGDASLWYKLAQANGLSSASALSEGATLTIPAGVNRTGNSASTVRPYDPSDAYGDTSPTTPKPVAAKNNNNCGVFGQILLVVIAVAVTIVATAGATALISGQAFGAVLGGTVGGKAVAGVSSAAWIAGGTIGAAIGSAVSQGIGVATGLQDQFSWKAVGLSALTAFLGPVPVGKVAGSAFLGNVIGGALTSAAVQGIAVATGLQSKFDFVGVAAAGLGAGVGGALGGAFKSTGSVFQRAGQQLAVGTARALANAATRSVAEGTDFGDNILAALPDVIGNTVGGLIASKVAASGRRDDARKQAPGAAGSTDTASAGGNAATSGTPIFDPYGNQIGSVTPDGRIIAQQAVFQGYTPLDHPGNATVTFDGDDIVITANKDVTDQARAANRAREAAYAREDAATNALLQNLMWSVSPLPQNPYASSSLAFRPIFTPPPVRINYLGPDRRWDLPDNTPQWKAYTAEDRARGYERARSSAFLNAGEGGAFGASLALLSGGDPDQIAAAGRLQGIVTDIAAGYAVSGSGSRVTLPVSGASAPEVYQQYWPPNRGFYYSMEQTLPPGTLIDRYGREGGTFTAPYGTPLGARALDYGSASKPYHVYEVLQPIRVQAGPATPWFGQPGMGTQYELPKSVGQLRQEGQVRQRYP